MRIMISYGKSARIRALAGSLAVLVFAGILFERCAPSQVKQAGGGKNRMMAEAFVRSLRQHDPGVLNRYRDAPPELAAEIDKALPELDEEARRLAVLLLERHDKSGSGDLLLKLSGDRSAQVANAAARSLTKVRELPLGEKIVSELPKRPDKFVRGQLYLAAGKTRSGLEALRRAAAAEPDSSAALDAQAAAVKLGGEPERKLFFERVRKAEPDDALRLADLLEYIGDRRLAKALTPWFANKAGVLRLGGDRQDRMARMCDLAVWTAHALGVPFPIDPEYLSVYGDAVTARARSAAASLPD
jgi:hypothetical protein